MPAPAPLSPVQAEALRTGTVPPLEEVRHGVWSLTSPATSSVADFSYGYLVEGSDGRLTLIDPGWPSPDAVDRLDAALHEIDHRLDDVDLIVATHLHVDHLGAADAVRRATGARLAMHPAEQRALASRADDAVAADADLVRWQVPAEAQEALVASWGSGRLLVDVVPDLLLDDGDELPVAGRRLRAVHTPGHTSGHLCLVEPEQRLIFTGDHVLPTINPGIGLGGRTAADPLDDVLASLARVVELDRPGADALEVCPGHEYRFVGLTERAETLVAHREERTRDALGALDGLLGGADGADGHAARRGSSAAPSVWQVAEAMTGWRGGLRSMSGLPLASALAQTEWHLRAAGRAGDLAS
ncbi:glyoxylase-like metal-dependent hydrolase (beta-lactamase superfamily II) [Frigoribacterium sp. PhB107]|uniref:MBL fold metallo-hydrolase n=1 Tax=Frigoribacterium sp. PhB107 TaxID=2485172 RepID=UPI000F4ADF6B|nr:MBL fold metallo-hydrolase [Frigoribacterium sp. PhB107]ROP77489.1 glyoxylase-like metal-dependent hydrolase (beta-lactamase superfamily II) [Frigoribacterium sp. PhB107]